MTEPNGSQGFTQKEMLIRIDSKLDAVSAHINAVELKQSIHEARPFHSTDAMVEMRKEILAQHEGLETLKSYILRAAGAVAVLVFGAPLLVYWLIHARG